LYSALSVFSLRFATVEEALLVADTADVLVRLVDDAVVLVVVPRIADVVGLLALEETEDVLILLTLPDEDMLLELRLETELCNEEVAATAVAVVLLVAPLTQYASPR